MDFYRSITENYHHIFPYNKMQKEFVVDASVGKESILEVGCAIGALTSELSTDFEKVYGIDLNSAMIEKASVATISNIAYETMNMLDIALHFGKNSFDTIVCFGNTLVHLDSEQEVLLFFKQVKRVLVKDGKFLIQIINYDRILDKDVTSLSSIDNEFIRFDRNYELLKDEGKVLFNTTLEIKESGEIIKNSISLLALKKERMESLLKKAGFLSISFYGDFKKSALSEDSVQLVVEAW